MLVCDHCMLEVTEQEAVHDELNGMRLVFCCHGCNGIYRLIRGAGLEEFYAKRRGWTPGPAPDAAMDVSLFLDGVRPAGSELETDIIIEGIRCASCVWLNEKILLLTQGISFARVNYATHRAKIRWDPAKIDVKTVLSRIRSIGYVPKPFLPGAWEEGQKQASRDLLIRFGTAGFFSMQLMMLSLALYAGYFQGIDATSKTLLHLLSLALATPVLFYAGLPILKGSLQGLANRSFTMDVLIASGALSAYGYSIYQMTTSGEVYFDTAGMIITLILLGRYLEASARTRASATISRLMQLSPRDARKVEADGAMLPKSLPAAGRQMVLVSTLRPGDLVEVVPGEKVPLDGVVVSGASEADESMLTGEPKPAPKSPGSQVYSGTMNLLGSFVFRVTAANKDTVLSRIIRTVEEAVARRSPIQTAANRAIGYLVPTVLSIALLTFFGWLVQGAPVSQAVMNAISVMVIACPCALGLATPLAILIGTSSGASHGILIKGGDVIEKTASVDFAVLDKTGTITEGKPVLAEAFAFGMPLEQALRLAKTVEQQSEHSLARAIVEGAHGIAPLPIADFYAVPGKGVQGLIQGKRALLGSREFIDAQGARTALHELLDLEQQALVRERERTGSTALFLSYDGAICGIFLVADQVRGEAAEAVALLTKAGITVAMVTGDEQSSAEAVAQKIGITQVKARVSPILKAEEIERLERAGRHVLMAGDGINDAPALVRATVGVAMGRATDIALESAEIVIMRPDLRLVAHAVALCKKTFSIIRQNIFWAFFYNIVFIPLAVLGMLHPIAAAAAMAFSSLSVVGNSLRAKTSFRITTKPPGFL